MEHLFLMGVGLGLGLIVIGVAIVNLMNDIDVK